MPEGPTDHNDILAWLRAGYDPHPVIPPGVPLHPLSKVEEKSRGKAPGLPVEGSEEWKGLQWLLPAPNRLRRQQGPVWRHAFAVGNGGCATGRRIIAVDIDCRDAGLAARLRDLTMDRCGWSPVRIGQPPKCLLMYLPSKDDLEQPTRVFNWTREGHRCGVEILAAGRQFVCKGTHPGTLLPYTWDTDPLACADMLAPLSSATVRRLIEDMRALMEGEGWTLAAVSSEGNRRSASLHPPEAANLRAGDMAVLASAVAHIPNTPDTSREDYIALGYALKAAAGPERETEGFMLWWDWAERWAPEDPERANTMERCEADWARLKPPYYLGADYVYDLAVEHGWSRLPVVRAGFADDPLPGLADLPDDPPPSHEPRPPNRDLSPEEQILAADFASDLTVVSNFLDDQGDDLLYTTDAKRWRRYEAGVWRELDAEDVKARLVQFIRWYAPKYFPPGEPANDRAREKLTNGNRLGSYAHLAPAVVKRRETLASMGQRTDLLTTPDGVIELRRGLPMRPHDPADLSLACTAVGPAPRGAAPTMFLDTLGYACAGVKDGVSYVQLALGNMLLGNPAQIVLVLWGRGGNGKSTVLEVVKAALGSGKTGYATASVMEMWQRSIDFATVHLTGKRAAIAAEFSPGLGWNESLVKAISGGDTQLSRDLHQSYAEQRVSCMPIFAFNDPPAFKRLNEAMLRRLSVIAGGMLPGSPNNRATIIEKDETMKARIIRDELPAVLRWMLDGAERVLAGESALRRPDDVMRGLEMLIGEQDRILGWIAANLIRSKDGAHRVTLAECVEILKGQIARDEDEETQRRLLPHIDARQFGNRLRAAGYEVTRGTGGVAVVKGVKMRGRLYDDAAVLDFAQARRNRVDWS